MKRLLMCTVFAAVTSFAAVAQEPPTTTPVEKSMDNATPDMKAPSDESSQPSNNAVDEAAPASKPSDAAPAQSTDAYPPSPTSPGLTLTEAEAKELIGKTIYSSDNENVGEVADFQRDADGKVIELHADIGGLLGLGETRVKVMPSQFQVGADRITLNVTKEETDKLPTVDVPAK